MSIPATMPFQTSLGLMGLTRPMSGLNLSPIGVWTGFGPDSAPASGTWSSYTPICLDTEHVPWADRVFYFPSSRLLLFSDEPFIGVAARTQVGVASKRALDELMDPSDMTPWIEALADVNPAVRSAAAQMLGERGEPLDVELWVQSFSIQAYSDINSKGRASAAAMLAKLGGPRAVEPLIEGLFHQHKIVRQAAQTMLVQLGACAVPELSQRLMNPAAAELLREIGETYGMLVLLPAVPALIRGFVDDKNQDPVQETEIEEINEELFQLITGIGVDALPALVHALSDETNLPLFARRYAMRCLTSIGDASSFSFFMEALTAQDEVIREYAVRGLGKLGDARAVPELTPRLMNPDESTREEAVTSLKEIGQASGMSTLLPALPALIQCFGGHFQQDIAVFKLLIQIGSDAVPELIRALTDDTILSGLPRRSAMRCLADIGDTRAFPVLIDALKDTDPRIRGYAQRGLGALGDARAVDPLIRQFDAADASIDNAVIALVKIGNPRAINPLIQALGRANVSGRIHAAKALGAFGDAQALEPLLAVLASQAEDKEVKAASAAALLEIGDVRAIQTLVAYYTMLNDYKSWNRSVEALVRLDRRQTDAAVVRALGENPEFLQREADSLTTFATHHELKATQVMLLVMLLKFRREQEQRQQEQELRAELVEKVEEIIDAISRKIAARLGLDLSHRGHTSASNEGSYGTVTMGLSQSLQLVPRLELRVAQELVPGQFINIEGGHSLEELKQRAQTLNFLVHHEVSHLIQEQLGIKAPALVLGAVHYLDPERAQHHANEVLIDKLGFDAARKIYVHGAGDIVFDEALREVIAIRAYAALMNVIVRNLNSGAHTLSNENMARIIAVASEMGRSKEIAHKTKQELKALAAEFYALVTLDQDEGKAKELDRLIKQYRSIFRQTSLPL